MTPDALRELDIQVASIEAQDDPTIKPLLRMRGQKPFHPSTRLGDWAQLVEKYNLSLRREIKRNETYWVCTPYGRSQDRTRGETIGIAVCRAVIALKGEKL